MEAVKTSGFKKREPLRSSHSRFVPVLPTLWPQMLLSGSSRSSAFPFEAPNARFYYFGRNAVWSLARILRFDQSEVLVPAYHHGVEIEALIDAGASLRFYQVGPRMEVDPASIKRLINSKTRAIYLIHYLGFPGPANALREIADANGLMLIEDCALALLSKLDDRPLGTFGDAAVFSFYKTLPVPNGGALVMRSDHPQGIPDAYKPAAFSIAPHLVSSLSQNIRMRARVFGETVRRVLRTMGRVVTEASSLESVATGTQHFERKHAKLGMSSISRRIAAAQDFSAIIERRRRNYFFLLGKLRSIANPIFGQLPPGVCPLFYPLRVSNKTIVMERLAARGIETVDFWSRGHPACPKGEFPDVEALRREIIEIPLHQDLDPELMAFVAGEVREAAKT